MNEFDSQWKEVLTELKLQIIRAAHGEPDKRRLSDVCARFTDFATAHEGLLNDNQRAIHVVHAFAQCFNSNDFSLLPPEKMHERLMTLSAALDDAIVGLVDTRDSEADYATKQNDSSKRVFLVHGHNEQILHQTARFLEGLELDVVILHEQPNSGRTIIEKFVDYSDVAFAVVLLTGDDRGSTSSTPRKDQLLRARQNVILELGFFLGKLGRHRVCTLYEDGVELPSDYSGVLFTALDSAGAWKLAIAKELKAARLPVDLNDIVQQNAG